MSSALNEDGPPNTLVEILNLLIIVPLLYYE